MLPKSAEELLIRHAYIRARTRVAEGSVAPSEVESYCVGYCSNLPARTVRERVRRLTESEAQNGDKG